MSILDNNRNTLAKLYEQYPESLDGLTMDGNFLEYKGERTDISQFDIERLLNENDNFVASLSVLSANDIFKIIRLHSEMMTSELELDTKNMGSDSDKRVEIIKSENPLMKNINLVSRVRDGFKEEYITIVDSTGIVHTFKNDYRTNIFDIYEMLKYRHPGQDVSPDELIQEVNRKLHEVRLEEASRFENHSDISEEFENKMRVVNKPYKNNNMYRVLGNQENDIAVIQDLHDGTQSKVVTFDNNRFGDLVVENHEANVTGTDYVNGDESKSEFDSSVADKTDVSVEYSEDKEIIARLITTQEFYDLLDSPADLTEDQRKSVDLYYAYLGDLMLYEDYLLEELKAILNSFRAYVDNLENRNNEVDGNEINYKQQEAINKNNELEIKKSETAKDLEQKLVDEKVKKLALINPNQYDNAASASIIQVIAFVIGVAIILTAVTLFLLS